MIYKWLWLWGFFLEKTDKSGGGIIFYYRKSLKLNSKSEVSKLFGLKLNY